MGMIAEPQSPWLEPQSPWLAGGLLTDDHNIMPSTLGRNRGEGNGIPRGATMFTTVCPDRSIAGLPPSRQVTGQVIQRRPEPLRSLSHEAGGQRRGQADRPARCEVQALVGTREVQAGGERIRDPA
jgi:hypothetical protein